MTQLRSRARAKMRGKFVALGLVLLGLVAMLLVTSAGSAIAQTTDCPAGGRGGAAGDAGRSLAGSGGLAFTIGGFGTAGPAIAPGGDGGSARGGDGGRGGSGTLPICNQNTNNVGAVAPAAAPQEVVVHHVYGSGGGLARTGSHTSTQIGLAGLAMVIGGLLLCFGQPRWGTRGA